MRPMRAMSAPAVYMYRKAELSTLKSGKAVPATMSRSPAFMTHIHGDDGSSWSVVAFVGRLLRFDDEDMGRSMKKLGGY